MAVRVLFPPQFEQQRRHQGASHAGPVHLGMAPRTEGDHQPEDRLARYLVVDREPGRVSGDGQRIDAELKRTPAKHRGEQPHVDIETGQNCQHH